MNGIFFFFCTWYNKSVLSVLPDFTKFLQGVTKVSLCDTIHQAPNVYHHGWKRLMWIFVTLKWRSQTHISVTHIFDPLNFNHTHTHAHTPKMIVHKLLHRANTAPPRPICLSLQSRPGDRGRGAQTRVCVCVCVCVLQHPRPPWGPGAPEQRRGGWWWGEPPSIHPHRV